MKSKSLYIFVLAAIVLALAGCQKNEINPYDAVSDGIVKFAPSVAQTGPSTKSAVEPAIISEGVLATEDGCFTVPVTCRSSEGISLNTAASQTSGIVATKGSLINDNANGNYSDIAFPTDKPFFAKAWTTGISSADFDYTKVLSRGSGAGQYWITVDDSDRDKEYLWKKGETKTFYAYANLPTVTDAAGVACTAASSQTLTYDVTKVPTAAQQTDILMGFYTNGSTPATSGLVPIRFSHPLTAVLFKLGTIEGVTSFAVNSISIEGVYASGTASMTPTTAAQSDPKDRFNWNPTGSAIVTQAIGNQPTTLAPAIGEAFLLIPQTFAAGSQARIAISCTIDGADRTLYWPLATTVWKAGYTNVYVLGYSTLNCSYDFSLTNETDAIQVVFQNTTTSKTNSIGITSTKTIESESPANIGYTIKSYRIGDGETQQVGGTSFNDGGLEVTVVDESTLRIKSQNRTEVFIGQHNYWVNSDSRENHLDWSPESWSGHGVIDLSRMDYTKDDADEAINAHLMTTANCYVIRHAGTYKLPLVYGNAIEGGQTNEQSYFYDLTENNRLARFVNHTGTGITDPFIENNSGCGGSDLKCAIVWQDKAEVVKSLQITPGTSSVAEGSYTSSNVRYLQFTISQEDICQNNALICIYKDEDEDGSYDEGEAVWSWHIWTTNDPALLTPAIDVTNYAGNHYHYFPLYCIGWIDAGRFFARKPVEIILEQSVSGKTLTLKVETPDVVGVSNGTYYQHGRKDPMCRVDNPTKGSFSIANGTVPLSTAIKNPATFYTETKVNNQWDDWCSTLYYNLWTGKFNGSSNNKEHTSDQIKTIYDPSPVGFKIPAPNASTGFTTTGQNSKNPNEWNTCGTYGTSIMDALTFKGFLFYTSLGPGHTKQTGGPTIFFPVTGLRAAGTGALDNYGTNGYFASDMVYSATYNCLFSVKYENIRTRHSASGVKKSSAVCIRPVLEESN